MSKQPQRFNVFSIQMLVILLIVAIPVVGLAYINYKIYERANTNIDDQLLNASNGIADTINTWLDMMARVGHQNAKLEVIKTMDRQAMTPALKTITDTYDWTYLTHVIDIDGHQIARSDDKPTFDENGNKVEKFDRASRKYFQQIRDGNAVGTQVVISKTYHKPALVMSVPIKTDDGGLVGVLARGSALDSVSKSIANAKIGQTGFAMLLDNENNLVAHGLRGQVGLVLRNLSDHPVLQTGTYNTPITFQEDDQKILAYLSPINLGWKLIVQQNYDEVTGGLTELQYTSIVITVITLILLLILILLLTRNSAKPNRTPVNTLKPATS